MIKSNITLNYIPQIDSIRAIAVLLVILSHWDVPIPFIKTLPIGGLGVDMFFVLSGFLITRILLVEKSKIENEQIGFFEAIKKFYLRRVLRIFPIYYLSIFFLLLFSKTLNSTITISYPFHLTYLSNIYFYKIASWELYVAHFWSLAVEEQFYLVWPWLILLIPTRLLCFVILIFFAFGVSFQFLFAEIPFGLILPIACVDSFAVGALLAWIFVIKFERLNTYFNYAILYCIIITVFYVIAWINPNMNFVTHRMFNNSITLIIIYYLLLNNNSEKLKFKFIFNSRILIYLGKISYGLYLYHNIIPIALNKHFINIYLNPFLPDIIYKNYWGYLFLIENIFLLLIISSGSYYLIERKFLELKSTIK